MSIRALSTFGPSAARAPSLAVVVALAGIPAVLRAQGSIHEDQELAASDGASADGFGTSVAVSGSVAIVGSYLAHAPDLDQGAAYVYRHDGVQWIEEQKLIASDAEAYDAFGVAVAIDGNTLVVGAHRDDDDGFDAGAAYVFQHDGNTWLEQVKLTAPDGASMDTFGMTVAISADVIVVGSMWDDDNGDDSGSVYVYRRSGGSWSFEQKLTALDGESYDNFGHVVAVDGDVIAIGAYADDDGEFGAGAVYVFRFEGGAWIEEQKLIASDPDLYDTLGDSIDVQGDLIAAGCSLGDGVVDDTGAVYLFRHDGSTWFEETKLFAPDGEVWDSMGFSVSVDGDRVLAGVYLDDDVAAGSGSAVLYQLAGSTWVELQKMTASDAAADDRLGHSVGLDGEHAILGAIKGDGAATDSGSAYAYRVPDLALDAEDDSVAAGDSLRLHTRGGMPNGLVLVAAVDVDGIPIFWKLDIGRFDAAGHHSFGGTVPDGLSGIVAQFQSYGFRHPGKLVASNRETVTFE